MKLHYTKDTVFTLKVTRDKKKIEYIKKNKN